jgi:plasmid maintenance system antidote protein VapI
MKVPYFCVKSDISSRNINFYELSVRLREYIQQRIDGGEFTERSLARILRISQPHLHNMMKGVRRLSVDFADRAMLKFGLSFLDLMSEEEILQFLDERNPNWLIKATARKPPSVSEQRKSDSRAPWRSSGNGSGS